jgi:hypothetical protein
MPRAQNRQHGGSNCGRCQCQRARLQIISFSNYFHSKEGAFMREPGANDRFGVDSVEKPRKQSLLAISGRASLCRRIDDSIFPP